MIILNLLVFAKEEIDGIVTSILKNKLALQVSVSEAVDSYHLDAEGIKVKSVVYTIQFATKSLLFEEIETSLEQEFPGTNFHMYANPIVHIQEALYNNIRNGVTGVRIADKENEEIILTRQHTTHYNGKDK